MSTQSPTLTDTLTNLNSRVSALESTSIDDNQPVDMFRSFVENIVANDNFTYFTHTYRVCSSNYVFVSSNQIEPEIVCSPDYIL